MPKKTILSTKQTVVPSNFTKNQPIITVILPCYNEEQAIGQCLEKIKNVLSDNNLSGEIIVSDSSTDRSADIAEGLANRVIRHGKIGYGLAYREALPYATGEYIFMADADGSYDFNEIPDFIAELRSGADLVIGNRLNGNISYGAMPALHRYFGTPFLSWLFRKLFNSEVVDINCGMRAITREALQKITFKTTGMEFATEMLVEASRKKLTIKQRTINYHPRIGQSKLKTFSDAQRHVVFMWQAFRDNYA